MPPKTPSLRERLGPSRRDLPACPECDSPDNVIRSGFRNNKSGPVRLYLCKPCDRRFTRRTFPHTSYSPKLILSALTHYNLGHTLAATNKEMRRRYKRDIPVSTIHGWVRRYAADLPFLKLRKRFILEPEEIIRSEKFHHVQVYYFRYHTLKLNIAAKRYPGLKKYIYSISGGMNDSLFEDGFRCSAPPETYSDTSPPPEVCHITTNAATRMTELALELARTNKERHEKVENFFLVNDTATVATEVPVYILPEELDAVNLPTEKVITGHIDIVQVRGNKVYVMDYKPGARNERRAYLQLLLYALALGARTNIELKNMVCAYFDHDDYFEFRPEYGR